MVRTQWRDFAFCLSLWQQYAFFFKCFIQNHIYIIYIHIFINKDKPQHYNSLIMSEWGASIAKGPEWGGCTGLWRNRTYDYVSVLVLTRLSLHHQLFNQQFDLTASLIYSWKTLDVTGWLVWRDCTGLCSVAETFFEQGYTKTLA